MKYRVRVRYCGAGVFELRSVTDSKTEYYHGSLDPSGEFVPACDPEGNWIEADPFWMAESDAEGKIPF